MTALPTVKTDVNHGFQTVPGLQEPLVHTGHRLLGNTNLSPGPA